MKQTDRQPGTGGEGEGEGLRSYEGDSGEGGGVREGGGGTAHSQHGPPTPSLPVAMSGSSGCTAWPTRARTSDKIWACRNSERSSAGIASKGLSADTPLLPAWSASNRGPSGGKGGKGSGCRVRGSGSGFRVRCAGFRVMAQFGVRVQGSGCKLEGGEAGPHHTGDCSVVCKWRMVSIGGQGGGGPWGFVVL